MSELIVMHQSEQPRKKPIEFCNFLIFLVFLSVGSTCEALDLTSMSLEELLDVEVDVAGKKSQSIQQIPQTIHLITRQQIKENGYRTIMEALASQPGFQLQKNWYLDRLVIRGQQLSLDKVLLLIDGQTMSMKSDNYNILNGAAPIAMQDIDAIEVLMGPNSTLYGSGAFVGVINVKTRDHTAGAALTVQVASPDEKSVHVNYGVQINSYQVTFSASSSNDNGEELSLYFPTGAPPDFTQADVTADGYNTLTTQRAAIKVKGEQLEFRAQYSDSSIGWPDSKFGTDLNNHGNRYDIKHTSMQLKYRHEYSGSLEGHARLYFNDSEGLWKGVYDGDLYLPPDGENYSGRNYGVEYKLDYELSDAFSVVSGLEHSQNDDVRSIDYEDDFYNTSLFGLADIFLSDNLEIEVGARAEKYSYHSRYELMPQLGMVYNLTPRRRINLAYGEGFIAPSTWVRQSAKAVSTSAPEPEKFKSLELSFHQQFDHYATSLSLFRSRQEDNIIFNYSGNTLTQVYNSEDVEDYIGVEWNNDLRLSNRTSLVFNASYVDAKAKPMHASSYDLQGIANQTANITLRSVIFNDQTVTFSYQYVGEIEGYPEIDAWNRFDITWYNRDFLGQELTLKLANIFDEEMYTYDKSSDALRIPDRSRHVMMTFSASF